MESPRNTTRFSPACEGAERCIGIAIALQFAEIVGVDGNPRSAVLIEAGGAGGGDSRGGLLGEADKQRQERKQR